MESEDIKCMDQPEKSPDLYTIEHMWEILGRCLPARHQPPATIEELQLEIQEESATIPQQLFDNLVLSTQR